jgi:hypothetical protein
MSIREQQTQNDGTKAARLGWFAAGVLSTLATLGLLVFAGPFLASAASSQLVAQTPPVIIEGR